MFWFTWLLQAYIYLHLKVHFVALSQQDGIFRNETFCTTVALTVLDYEDQEQQFGTC